MTGQPLEEAEVRRRLQEIRYATRYVLPQHRTEQSLLDEAVIGSWLAQARVIEAARDPFLVILESHPDAEPHVNAEMKRAADNFRAALKALKA